MKNIAFAVIAGIISFSLHSQNTNTTSVSRTTTTTIKDSEGEKKLVKNENVNEVQNVEFHNAESNALNKDVKPSPVQVTATTSVTLPDGTTRMVDVDRSAYYSLGGNRYKMALDKTGYTLLDPTGKREAVLRQTQNNNFIYRTKDRTSFGYFDANGNLILETYDDKADKITVETFTRMP